jgi:hypothetical protein
MGFTIIHHTKKDGTIRMITDFKEVNKRLVRKPFPIPKIGTVLKELEGFTYTTTLDLNMGYYTIRLDPDSSKICTLIFRGTNSHTYGCHSASQVLQTYFKQKC